MSLVVKKKLFYTVNSVSLKKIVIHLRIAVVFCNAFLQYSSTICVPL